MHGFTSNVRADGGQFFHIAMGRFSRRGAGAAVRRWYEAASLGGSEWSQTICVPMLPNRAADTRNGKWFLLCANGMGPV